MVRPWATLLVLGALACALGSDSAHGDVQEVVSLESGAEAVAAPKAGGGTPMQAAAPRKESARGGLDRAAYQYVLGTVKERPALGKILPQMVR
jgi:hypothetical protein